MKFGIIAAMAWLPASSRVANAIYCYPGDPPDVYQACVAYNAGINQQVNNQRQLQNIQNQIHDVQAQINALYALIQSLNNQIAAQQALFAQVQAQRAAIDAQVADLARQYDAAAVKAGGGTGVFEWPEPSCGFGCISQGFGCSTFYLEIYDPACPYPHRIHTGLDTAGPY